MSFVYLNFWCSLCLVALQQYLEEILSHTYNILHMLYYISLHLCSVLDGHIFCKSYALPFPFGHIQASQCLDFLSMLRAELSILENTPQTRLKENQKKDSQCILYFIFYSSITAKLLKSQQIHPDLMTAEIQSIIKLFEWSTKYISLYCSTVYNKCLCTYIFIQNHSLLFSD